MKRFLKHYPKHLGICNSKFMYQGHWWVFITIPLTGERFGKMTLGRREYCMLTFFLDCNAVMLLHPKISPDGRWDGPSSCLMAWLIPAKNISFSLGKVIAQTQRVRVPPTLLPSNNFPFKFPVTFLMAGTGFTLASWVELVDILNYIA